MWPTDAQLYCTATSIHRFSCSISLPVHVFRSSWRVSRVPFIVKPLFVVLLIVNFASNQWWCWWWLDDCANENTINIIMWETMFSPSSRNYIAIVAKQKKRKRISIDWISLSGFVYYTSIHISIGTWNWFGHFTSGGLVVGNLVEFRQFIQADRRRRPTLNFDLVNSNSALPKVTASIEIYGDWSRAMCSRLSHKFKLNIIFFFGNQFTAFKPSFCASNDELILLLAPTFQQ